MPNDNIIRYSFEDIGKNDSDWQCEQALLKRFNAEHTNSAERRELLLALFGEAVGALVNPPLMLTRGRQVRLGHKVFINSNVTISGGAPVTIGPHTLVGPNVQLLTVTHPVDPTERQRWAFWAMPITIGENVWIGASAIICAGVTIGDHSVIGAGSVVTKNIPACVLAAGNPCKVIRELDPPDRATLYELNP